MSKRPVWFQLCFLLTLIAAAILTACGSEQTAPQIEGPALVLFYTDN
jgi:hypothetical protein